MANDIELDAPEPELYTDGDSFKTFLESVARVISENKFKAASGITIRQIKDELRVRNGENGITDCGRCRRRFEQRLFDALTKLKTDGRIEFDTRNVNVTRYRIHAEPQCIRVRQSVNRNQRFFVPN